MAKVLLKKAWKILFFWASFWEWTRSSPLLDKRKMLPSN